MKQNDIRIPDKSRKYKRQDEEDGESNNINQSLLTYFIRLMLCPRFECASILSDGGVGWVVERATEKLSSWTKFSMLGELPLL